MMIQYVLYVRADHKDAEIIDNKHTHSLTNMLNFVY